MEIVYGDIGTELKQSDRKQQDEQRGDHEEQKAIVRSGGGSRRRHGIQLEAMWIGSGQTKVRILAQLREGDEMGKAG